MLRLYEMVNFNNCGGVYLVGKIAKLIRNRGFGFISIEDQEDIFFHRSDVKVTDFKDLKKGNAVEFNMKKGPKGLRAVDIKKVDSEDIEVVDEKDIEMENLKKFFKNRRLN